MQNLTGIPAIFGDLELAAPVARQLSEEEQLARKKKLLAAGQPGDFASAVQTLFGGQLNSAGNPRA